MNVLAGIERNKLAVHFHDTFGNAIPNILISLDHGNHYSNQGIRTVDSSVAGIGGCPYSKTPIGNVCTELVVQAL